MELKQINNMECPNCCGALENKIALGYLECPYCGSRFQNPNASASRPAAPVRPAAAPAAPAAPKKPKRIPAESEYPTIVRYWVDKHGRNSTYVLMDKELDKSNRRYRNAIKKFGIPAEEEIFLILDATVFGTCGAGFAVCAGGVYYVANAGDSSEGQVHLTWKQVLQKDFSVEGGNFFIGKAGFNAANDVEPLKKIFSDITRVMRGE